jgi:hypothetical protein
VKKKGKERLTINSLLQVYVMKCLYWITGRMQECSVVDSMTFDKHHCYISDTLRENRKAPDRFHAYNVSTTNPSHSLSI